jgi:hypothetical protein
MYLYPGEEELFLGNAGYNTIIATLEGYGRVTLLSCNGNCERSERPLACRVFPLAPKIDNGMVSVRMDPRGRPVCPLCHQPKSSLSASFTKSVETVFTELLAEPSMLAYLTALSHSLDEYEKPIL